MQGITMKRTDLQVRHDIQDELAWDPNLSARNIGVWVTDGIATLSGNVATQLEKSAAEVAAWRIPGIEGLESELSVDPPSKSTVANTSNV